MISEAELYDLSNPWAGTDDDEFYLNLVLSAGSVLDIGCGTGKLLHHARWKGHSGRLSGLDPNAAMLTRAQKYPDIDWIHGDLSTVTWHNEFELAIMMGHAFQCLITDADVRTTLTGVHQALMPNGRFVFETRNPLARAWETWTPDNVATITHDGETIKLWYQVTQPRPDIVDVTETYATATWEQVFRAQLRFLTARQVTERLTDAGFEIEAQYGNWDRSPYTDTSREIITVGRRR